MKIVRALVAALLILFCSTAIRADEAACHLAVLDFNIATVKIASNLKRYETCVSGSQARDNCSSEFRRLRSAQSDFENAVSANQTSCQ